MASELKPVEKSTLTSDTHRLVEARLQSAKVLSDEIKKVIRNLRVVLGLEEDDHSANDTTNQNEGVEQDEADAEGNKLDEMLADSTQSQDSTSASEGREEGAWRGFELNADDKVSDSRICDPHEHESDEDTRSIASSSSSSSGPPTKRRQTEKLASGSKQSLTAGESTFLPSLSVGFVGGSDSDWSDAEADLADAPVKKNRRGQRARKAYVFFQFHFFHVADDLLTLTSRASPPPCVRASFTRLL